MKSSSGIFSALLFLSMVASASNIQPLKAQSILDDLIPDITVGLSYDPQGNSSLIWNPSHLFYHYGSDLLVSEVFWNGQPVTNIQGIVYDYPDFYSYNPTSCLIWNSSRLFYHYGSDLYVREVTWNWGRVTNIQGIIFDPLRDSSLIWNSSRLFYHYGSDLFVSEVFWNGQPVTNIQGIVYDPSGAFSLIWNPSHLFYHYGSDLFIGEVLWNWKAVINVQNIVYDPEESSYSCLIWNSSRLFYHYGSDWWVGEVLWGGPVADVQGIVYDPVGLSSLVWNPKHVFYHNGSDLFVSAVTWNGQPITNVQGIVYDSRATFYISLIWNSSRLFYHFDRDLFVSEVTWKGGPVTNIQGIAYDFPDVDRYYPRGTSSLIWNSSRLFYHFDRDLFVSEVTWRGGPVTNIQGIVCDPTWNSFSSLVWNSSGLFHHYGSDLWVDEVLWNRQPVPDVQGIVYDPEDINPYRPRPADSLIWCPKHVFHHYERNLYVDEATWRGEPITGYDPTQRCVVQAVIHHIDPCAAGIVGSPASTSVKYTGTANAATIVESSFAPSSRSTIVGASHRFKTALILGPSAVSGVLTMNSMKLFVLLSDGYAYTDRSRYAVGETVIVGFRNTGSTTITLPNTAPWVILDSSGLSVYNPIASTVLVYVRRGEKIEWQWNQRDNSGQRVSPGAHTFWIETSAGIFTAEFSITTGPPGRKLLTTDPSTQDMPSIIVADTPGFRGYFLAYQSWETGEAYGGDIFVEKYDENWNFLRRARATDLPSYQDSPSLALVFDGYDYYLKLAYVSYETGNYDVFAETFDLNLNFVSKKQITGSASDQDLPSIVFDGSQLIYIAYQSWEAGSSYEGDIFIEKLNLNLASINKVRVTSETSYQDCPSLFYNSRTGIIYVAYVSNETGNLDIFLKQYDSNLNYLNRKFQLTTHSTTQNRPSLAPMFSTYPAVRGFRLAYHSLETGTSSNRDIFVKEFDLDCNELRTIQITDDQFYSATPSITPSLAALDSSWCPSYVAYVSDEKGDWDIWLQELIPVTSPNLSLFEPQISGLTVTVNGTVSPGQAGTSITRIRWNWGDGYEEDRWFPASHTYAGYSDYTITATAYQSDGLSLTTAKRLYQLIITVSPIGSGFTNPTPGKYLCNLGQFVTVSAAANNGYSFDHWELDGSNVGKETSYTVLMNRAYTLKAVFSGRPDLIISNTSWTPVNPVEGNTVTFNVTVKNNGTLNAASFRVAYYIDEANIGDWFMSSLSVGQATSRTFIWTALYGVHKVKTFADFSFSVQESNETNNEREETIQVAAKPKPDLIIQAISWSPINPVEGETVTFSVTVKNNGTVDAGAFKVAYYIDGVKLGEWPISNLGAGQNITKTFNWIAVKGRHVVRALADSSNEIAEENETNNDREESVGNQAPMALFCCRNEYDYLNNSLIFACKSTCFNASQSYDPDGTIANYTWNFGDGNITQTTDPIIIHVYENVGNCTVVLNVTDNQGLWNAIALDVRICLLGDLDNDRRITVIDVALVAKAYGSRPYDFSWDTMADLNNDGWVNVIDVAMVAKEFGKAA